MIRTRSSEGTSARFFKNGKRSEGGDQIHQALLALQADQHLEKLMDAVYTNDHAPKGSLARALEKVVA